MTLMVGLYLVLETLHRWFKINIEQEKENIIKKLMMLNTIFNILVTYEQFIFP